MTLAEDLVTAAARAMQGAAYGPATKRKARAAIVAVLSELDSLGYTLVDSRLEEVSLGRLATRVEAVDRG